MNGRTILGAWDLGDLAARLEAGSIPEPNSGCLLWAKAYATNGYGKIRLHGVHIRTHRAAWLAAHGPIPVGLVVCHKCDVRECINPAHLFLGTRADNNRDMHVKGRLRHKVTPEMLSQIRKDCRSNRKIAAAFGVAFSTVAAIKRGETWAWVPQ